MADHSRGLPSEGTDYQSPPNAVVALLPTPAAQEPGGTIEQYHQRLRDHDGRESSFLPLSMVVQLLPTPDASPEKFRVGGDSQQSKGLMGMAARGELLPTPRTVDVSGIKTSQRAKDLYGSSDSMGDVVEKAAWGEYEPAIRRWEAITRPAPDPTKPNAKGNPKLSDEFDEWLMGLPAGWITDIPGVTWNEALKACGNGVVPQQAVAAVRWLRVMATWQVAA